MAFCALSEAKGMEIRMGDIPVIKAALLGAGTVGGGVYEILKRQREEMPKKLGVFVEITKILVRDKGKKREGMDSALFTEEWEEILADPDIQIVIELMGGIEPARTYLLEALQAGKHVVTANKDLLADYGRELLDTAWDHGCDLMFEAAVAGGIPIIRPLKQCLAANYITEIMGIVNGTTNYILTRMTQDKMEFSEALALASELGYAEADPTADVEGYDAGRKVAIMASIAFNSRVTFGDVFTEGITKITAADIAYADELNMVIKLLGVAKNVGDGIEAGVYPMLIPKAHPLASVQDAFNAVFIHGDAVDDAMFLGRGAGRFPTGSAVAGDIFEIVRNIQAGSTGRLGCTCYKNLRVKPADETSHRYFLRLQVEDRPGVLAGIASVFGNNNVSIAQVIQKNKRGELAELAVITEQVLERHFKDSLLVLGEMSMIKEISTILRVYA